MSSQFNLLTDNQPLLANYWNENVNCQQSNIYQQQGAGVLSGMTLSFGTWPAVNVSAGWVQNPRTVAYGGGSFNMPSTAGTYYIMANWTNAYNPGTGQTVYTFTFTAQSSPTPPSGQVCLGCIVQTTSAFVLLSTAGRFQLPRVSGFQWIAGQNRLIVDDSTGLTTVQNLQGTVAVKNALQSGDAGTISANYQALLFGSFSVPAGATFTCSGQLRVIS